MLKLKKYAKPYMALLLIGVLLVFGQSLASLELPNIMSEIVNVGIQNSGITEKAPKAISAQSFELISTFVPREDADFLSESYTTLSSSELAEKQSMYPNANETTLFVKDLSEQELEKLDSTFSTATYAMMMFLNDMGAAMGQTETMPQGEATASAEATAQTQDSANMDMASLQSIAPMLAQMPQSALDEYINTSLATDAMMKESVASVFVKGYYEELNTDTGAIQTNYIFITGMQMLLFCIIIVVCAIAGGYCLAKFGASIARDLRRDVFAKVTTFTSAELDKFSTASLITRTTNDVTQVQTFLSMGLRMLFLAPLTGIGGIIMALRISPSMAWILALAIGVMLCIIGILFIVAVPKFKIMQTLVDKLNLVSRESLSGMMVIRAFSNQNFEEERFDKANKTLSNNMLFANRAIAAMMPAIMFIMNGIMLLIVWVGAEQIAASALQVGDMMAYMQYAMQVVMSFLFISMIFILMPRASVSAERMHEVLSTEITVKDKDSVKTLSAKGDKEITFNNVYFSYPGAEESVLENINFTAKPGQTTAFIGSTGSGKSTLINLIPRFYDITKGSITINGTDVRDLAQHDLRDMIGYVPQKGLLFSGDINSNLHYGDESADDATIKKAAEVAQAEEFIQKLENGLDTEISQGGTNVSGGQRQRLSIARALVKKAPIYIFDDTFSALDFKTDAKLRRALNGYTENATVLIVAQRVSTIMSADQIIVLDEGRIAGMGTHRELLVNCDTYREIAQSQLSKEELE